MSKKIAGGSDAIVLDVTYGKGAFMKSISEARKLAQAMINIGKIADKPVICVLTPMNQPLGYSIGNVLEIKEAWQTICGNGPKDLLDTCLLLTSCMAYLYEENSGVDSRSFDLSRYEGKILETIESGKAARCFQKFIKSQGGLLDDEGNPVYSSEPVEVDTVYADHSGYITELDALLLGEASMILGAGRYNKSDSIDAGAGIVLEKKVGDPIQKGDAIFRLYRGAESSSSEEKVSKAKEKCRWSFTISDNPNSLLKNDVELLF